MFVSAIIAYLCTEIIQGYRVHYVKVHSVYKIGRSVSKIDMKQAM